MVDLLWVRDHYDFDKNRYIDFDEISAAVQDYFNAVITNEQLQGVQDAYDDSTSLPAYSTAKQFISFIIPTGATIKVDGVQYD